MKYFKDNYTGYFQDIFGTLSRVNKTNKSATNWATKKNENIPKQWLDGDQNHLFHGYDLQHFCNVGTYKVGLTEDKMYIQSITIKDGKALKSIDLPEPIERITYVRDFMVLKGKENIYYYGRKFYVDNDDLFPAADVFGEFEKAPSTITYEGTDYKVKDIQISMTFKVFLLEGDKALIKYKEIYYFIERVKKAFMNQNMLILLSNSSPTTLNIMGDAINTMNGKREFYVPYNPLSLEFREGAYTDRNKTIHAIRNGNFDVMFFPFSFILKIDRGDGFKYIGYGDFSFLKNSPVKYLITQARKFDDYFPGTYTESVYQISNDCIAIINHDDDTIYIPEEDSYD